MFMLKLGSEFKALIDEQCGIVEQNLSDNGYVRFANGMQIAWKKIVEDAGGTLWVAPIYYSDHSLGEWVKPFIETYIVNASVKVAQYWATSFNWNNISAGRVRVFRPTAVVDSITMNVIAIGKWK